LSKMTLKGFAALSLIESDDTHRPYEAINC
jgi:hypothetical protein